MGKQSQRRKDEKRRAEERRREQIRTGAAQVPPPAQPTEGIAALRNAFQRATTARRTNDLAALDRAVDELDATASLEAGTVVSDMIVGELSRQLRACWRRGWQPIDVVNVTRRLLDNAHADVAAAAVADDAKYDAGQPMHPQWAGQLENLDPWWEGRTRSSTPWLLHVADITGTPRRAIIEQGVDLIDQFSRLPNLPTLIPPPGPGAAAAARSHASFGGRGAPGVADIDEKVLAKVRALLAKAESTPFPEEAESFTGKAQELMTRHSIDRAMIDAVATTHGAPEGRRIHLEPPYIDAKSSLANAVGSANRCDVVLASKLGFITLFGFASDLAVVDVLFTSLLAQATTAMVAAGRVLDRAGTSKTKSFRHSFLISYAHRIGQRLRESAEVSVHDAEATHGASLLPVLASRDLAVKTATAAAFPKLVTRSQRVSNEAGWQAGKIAADQASLGAWGAVRAGG